jgi:hypothetical protein
MALCPMLFNAYKHVCINKSSANVDYVMWPYIESDKGKKCKDFNILI